MQVHQESAITDSKQLTYDEALTQVGGEGFYQKRAFLIFGLQWLITSWILFSPVFFFIKPTIDCQSNAECLNSCTSESLDEKCLAYICDDSFRQEFVIGESLNTAFNALLPCHKTLQSIIQSIVYLGSVSGLIIFSFIADNYGRKMSMSISWSMTSLGALIVTFAMNYQMIAIGLFFLGFGGNPTITVHYSFINEHSQGNFREIQNVGVQVFFALGEFGIIALAYFITNWRWLAVSVAIPSILLNIGNLLIFESPQFLYTKNKKKCVKVLNQIAKLNGTQPINIDDLQSNPQIKENNSRVYSILDLLKYKSLRYYQLKKQSFNKHKIEDLNKIIKKLLALFFNNFIVICKLKQKNHLQILMSKTCLNRVLFQFMISQQITQNQFIVYLLDANKHGCLFKKQNLIVNQKLVKISFILFCLKINILQIYLKFLLRQYVFFAGVMMFFAIKVTYYGISFVSDQLGLNFFTTNFIIAFFELLAFATLDFFITKLKRKTNIITGFFIIGLMSLYFLFQSDHIVFRIFEGIFAGMMRFLVCAVWALGYIYVSELFPSVVRSLALCLISAGGSFGSIAQAFLSNLCSSLHVHPMIGFGVICILCSLLLFPLRETLHQPLREKIEEDQTRIRKSMIHVNDSEKNTSYPVLLASDA